MEDTNKKLVNPAAAVPGAATFRAALLWDATPPDRQMRILVPGDREAEIHANSSFKILDGTVWKQFFAFEPTVITGPAVISAPVRRTREEDIFEKSAMNDVASLVAGAVLVGMCLGGASITTGIWTVSVALVIVAAILAGAVLSQHGSVLFGGRSSAEKGYRKLVADHDILPPPAFHHDEGAKP